MTKKRILVLLPLIVLIITSNLMVRLGTVNYNLLIKPVFAPSMILFVIAWSIIYIILYITTYQNIKNKDNYKTTLISFYIILLFHFLWMFFFFVCNFQLISIFILISIYIFSISYIYGLYKENKKALYANIFYMLWLIYALLLNISIFILN